MKKKMLLLLGVVFFISCSDDTEESSTTPVASNIIEVTENIDAPTTWLEGKVYIIKKNDFYVNNTLSIEPGTIIKFHPSYSYMTLGGTGTIVANGTADKPIIFTSYKDDAHGGDSNADAGATLPARKDWARISTNGLNGSIFNYCEFYYGGSGSYTSTLEIYGGYATVTNCTFANNDGSDGSMQFGALDAGDATSGTIIQNNVFYNNIRPLSISSEFNLDNSNTFHNPANTSLRNTFNYIYVESINDINSNISWSETEVPYLINDVDFWINGTYTLTLANNVVLKFTPSSQIVCNNGSSNIVNYNGTGVYFTSIKDDSVNSKGDSNGDGSLTTPSANDWVGIYDNTAPFGDPNYFSWSNILYD